MKPVSKWGRTVGAEAWAAYNEAFRNYLEKARIVQSQAENPNITRAQMDAATLEMESARNAYRVARDAAAQELLERPARHASAA
jgi:hypothetical protein